MEHYSQSNGRVYASHNAPVGSQTRLDAGQPEQQLPSIRDVSHRPRRHGFQAHHIHKVIPPTRSNTLESNNHDVPAGSRTMTVPYLSSQHTTSMNMAPVPAPTLPQTSPMAFNPDATGQMHMNAMGPSHHLQTPARTPAEYSSPWSSSSSFSTEASVPMSTQPTLSGQPQAFNGMSQPMIPSDTQDSVFSSAYSVNRPYPAPQDSEESFSRWRTPQVGSTPRYNNPYLVSERSYSQPLDYSRYGQSYDHYRSPLGYEGGYRAMDTSPYHMKYNQLLSYPIMGYPSHANGRRRRGNLPKPITDMLRLWLQEHMDHPYPTDEQKQIFIQRTGLTISQVSHETVETIVPPLTFGRSAIGLSTLVGGSSRH